MMSPPKDLTSEYETSLEHSLLSPTMPEPLSLLRIIPGWVGESGGREGDKVEEWETRERELRGGMSAGLQR